MVLQLLHLQYSKTALHCKSNALKSPRQIIKRKQISTSELYTDLCNYSLFYYVDKLVPHLEWENNSYLRVMLFVQFLVDAGKKLIRTINRRPLLAVAESSGVIRSPSELSGVGVIRSRLESIKVNPKRSWSESTGTVRCNVIVIRHFISLW